MTTTPTTQAGRIWHNEYHRINPDAIDPCDLLVGLGAVEAEARDATGLREALEGLLSQEFRHDSNCGLPSATEPHGGVCDCGLSAAVDAANAALAAAPPEPRWPSDAKDRLRRAVHRYDGLVQHHQPGWIDADLCYQCDTIAGTLLGNAQIMDATGADPDAILAALREGGER